MSDHWRRAQLQQVSDAWRKQAARAERDGASQAPLWKRAAKRAAELLDEYRALSEELD